MEKTRSLKKHIYPLYMLQPNKTSSTVLLYLSVLVLLGFEKKYQVIFSNQEKNAPTQNEQAHELAAEMISWMLLPLRAVGINRQRPTCS